MTTLRIAIIDDDPFVADHLRLALAEALPTAELYMIEEPVPVAGYDVYVVDNDFGGEAHGAELHDRLRAIAPGAELVVYSAELDTSFLRRLMRGGAREVFDKSSSTDRDAMIARIVDADARKRSGLRRRATGLGAVGSVTALLREWNHRLQRSSTASRVEIRS